MSRLQTAGWLACVAALLLTAACGSKPEPEEREGAFDPLVGTLDRAEGVQQTVDQQAAELRRRIEEAEQGQSN